MYKYLGSMGSITLVRHPVKEKENSEFKPADFQLKTYFVLYPAIDEGLNK